jgi:hypothetical protein
MLGFAKRKTPSGLQSGGRLKKVEEGVGKVEGSCVVEQIVP